MSSAVSRPRAADSARALKHFKEFDSSIFKSYNSIMHGYVLLPAYMLEDLDNVIRYLDESYDYVMSLESK